jgi:hypothetical protein
LLPEFEEVILRLLGNTKPEVNRILGVAAFQESFASQPEGKGKPLLL